MAKPTSQELEHFCLMVSRKYGEDVGQQTALEMLEKGTHDLPGYPWRKIGWLLARSHNQRLGKHFREKVTLETDLEHSKEEAGHQTNTRRLRLFEILASSGNSGPEQQYQAIEILKNKTARRLMELLSNPDGRTVTNQRIEQLRRQLQSELGIERPRAKKFYALRETQLNRSERKRAAAKGRKRKNYRVM